MGVRPPILENASDFDAWKVDIESLLVIKGCDDAIEDAPAGQDAAVRKAHDRMAKAYILSYVSPRFKKELATLSAMEMWTRLRVTYETCLLARRLRLQGDFASIAMKAKESVEAYFGRARGLISDLKSCGENITEHGSVARVLEGLSREFDNMVETIVFHMAADPRKWSWDRVVCFVIEGEARLARKATSSRDEGGAALYTRGGGQGMKNAGKGSGRNGRRQPQQETGACYFCGKVGHWKRDCLKFRRVAEKQGGSVGAALVTCAGRHEGPCWTLDSGCTDHMTGDKSTLSDYREVATPWQITIADGSSKSVVGVGTAKLDTEAGSATLHDVLHVKGLTFNLASVLRMDQRGAAVVIQHGQCEVRLHGRVVLRAVMHEGLYKIRTFAVFRSCPSPPWPPKDGLKRPFGTSV